MKNNKLTLKEIAYESNVSISTVSRVISNSPNVNSETREKILSVMNNSNLSYSKRKTGLIAMVVPDNLNPFFPLLLKSIESISRLMNYNLILCNSEYNSKIESSIIDQLSNIHIDGLIFIGAGKPPEVLKRMAKDKTLPIVCLDRDPGLENVSTVTIDNKEAMFQATSYLFSLGHRDILYISGPKHLSTEKERYLGFLKAFSERSLYFNPKNIRYGNYFLNDAANAINQLIADGEFNYSAVCCANDLMAMGVYKALKENGIDVPAQVSITGFDGIPLASAMGITSIKPVFDTLNR